VSGAETAESDVVRFPSSADTWREESPDAVFGTDEQQVSALRGCEPPRRAITFLLSAVSGHAECFVEDGLAAVRSVSSRRQTRYVCRARSAFSNLPRQQHFQTFVRVAAIFPLPDTRARKKTLEGQWGLDWNGGVRNQKTFDARACVAKGPPTEGLANPRRRPGARPARAEA
jgi:hypothetical protein